MNIFTKVSTAVAEEVPMLQRWGFVGIYLGYESAGKREENTQLGLQSQRKTFSVCFYIV